MEPCPACNNTKLRPARRVGLTESFLFPLVLTSPYRCESCGDRHYRALGVVLSGPPVPVAKRILYAARYFVGVLGVLAGALILSRLPHFDVTPSQPASSWLRDALDSWFLSAPDFAFDRVWHRLVMGLLVGVGASTLPASFIRRFYVSLVPVLLVEFIVGNLYLTFWQRAWVDTAAIGFAFLVSTAVAHYRRTAAANHEPAPATVGPSQEQAVKQTAAR